MKPGATDQPDSGVASFSDAFVDLSASELASSPQNARNPSASVPDEGADAAGTTDTDTDTNDEDVQLGPAELIQQHSRGVWRYLRMLGCDDSTADDLTQETFLRVLRRETFVQHSESATAAYLRRTAYNLMVSAHRKNRRVQTIAEASAIDEIWNRWAGKDLNGDLAIEVLKDCFSKLTDRAQLSLRMRFRDGASRLEIAEALEISDHGARNLMQRAKETLKTCIEAKMRTIENE